MHITGEIQPQPLTHVEYSIQPKSECVQITCHFKRDSSATDCLVVVHQQLTQINLTRGLMNLEANWTRRFTHRGDTASGCIHGVDLGLHQIGVANGRKVRGTCISNGFVYPSESLPLYLINFESYS